MEDEIDLRQYVGVLWRRRYLIAATTLAAALVAALLSYLVLAPVYEASSLLLVSEPRLRSATSSLQTPLWPPLTVENVIPMIHNEIVAAQVGLKLGTATSEPRELMRRVKLSRVRASNLLKVTARDSTPRGAEALARAWNEAIVAYVDSLALDDTRQALSAVEQKVAAARAELVEAEELLRDFQAATKIPIMNQRVQETVQRVALYESRLTEMEQGGAPVAGEVTLRPSGSSYALSVTSVRSPAQLRRVLAVLRSDLDGYQHTLAEEHQRETRLLRRVDLARSTHQLLVQKREELRILLGANTGTVRVGLPPVRPKHPAAPRPLLNMALASVLGLMAGTMLAFVVEYFRPAARPAIAPSASAPAMGSPRPTDR